MLNVVILGSTGSLGTQTLQVLEKYRSHFKVVGLAANTNQNLLKKQAKKFKVKNLVLAAKNGQKAITKLAVLKEADIVINVLSGTSGIAPSLAALRAKKILLLGNKESLFVEGESIMNLAGFPRATPLLIPLDSEHNAIFEILQKVYEEAAAKNLPPPKIKKIILPCSGGPFYGRSKAFLAKVTPAQACKHPHYKMGQKISIESATLINKGLEIIEAHHLFGLPLRKIATASHPECKIHGAVEFESTPKKPAKTIAYISSPDMREHLENALLRAANLPIPKRKIVELSPSSFSHSAKYSRNTSTKEYATGLHAPVHQPLPPLRPGSLHGLSLVLKVFRKSRHSPKLLKSFLLREEKAIKKFRQNKIKLTDIFKI